MCVCVFTCTKCPYVDIHICVYVYMCLYAYMSIDIYVNLYAYMYTSGPILGDHRIYFMGYKDSELGAHTRGP